jgi:hypothetical protein
MHNLFRDIIALPGVRGVLLISFKGEILYESFQPAGDRPSLDRDWHLFLETLAEINEADLAFANDTAALRYSAAGAGQSKDQEKETVFQALKLPDSCNRLDRKVRIHHEYRN